MKTVKSTGPLLYAINNTKGIPKGKVHVHLVRYETFEMDDAGFDATKFKFHDASQPEPRTIAGLVESHNWPSPSPSKKPEG